MGAFFPFMYLGVSLPALQVAGGLLLSAIAVQLVIGAVRTIVLQS